MYETILIIHVVISSGLIAMVLLQQGKGAGMGALGGGTSNSLFGSQGSANFMSRTTAMLATGFFLTSLTLSYLAIKQVKAAQQESLPVAPVEKTIHSDVPGVATPETTVPAPEAITAPETTTAPAVEAAPETAAPAAESAPETTAVPAQ